MKWPVARRSGRVAVGLIALLVTAGCTTAPAPVVIYEDRQDAVWLMFDPAAGTGHSHPASITPEQIMKVLQGVRVRGRDVFVGFGVFADEEGVPAFSLTERTRLATHLAQALKKASPKDLVTFYIVTQDPDRGKLVTSGGLFVRQNRLYFMLANAHTSPSSVQYENTYEIGTRDQPLLPLARYKFTVGFMPPQALVSKAEVRGTRDYQGYMDESKLLVIDLGRLFSPRQGTPSAQDLPSPEESRPQATRP